MSVAITVAMSRVWPAMPGRGRPWNARNKAHAGVGIPTAMSIALARPRSAWRGVRRSLDQKKNQPCR